MSYDILKSISFRNNKVFLTSADSSLRPLHFYRWESEWLSSMLQSEGKRSVLIQLGKSIWNGSLKLYKGNKTCNLYLYAMDQLPKELHWSNTSAESAGEYLGTAVSNLLTDPDYDLTNDIKNLLELRNDRDYLLENAKAGYNFLDFTTNGLKYDYEFAMKLLKTANGSVYFAYPREFTKDRNFALEAVKMNGCYFRELHDSLKADKEIIFEAFREDKGRCHEHLPDVIDMQVYFIEDIENNSLLIDYEFVKNLIKICPSLHIERCAFLLKEKDIVHTWLECGKWFLNTICYISKEILEEEEIKNILLNRCAGQISRRKLKEELMKKEIDTGFLDN